MSNLFYLPRVHSEPLAKLYFYQTGTSTPQNTYTDIDLQVAHTNPVVADADGYFDPIYLDPSLPNYRVIHTDTNDVPLEPTLDGVPAAGSSESAAYRLKSASPGLIFEETDGSTDNKMWRIRVAGEVLSIATGDDAEAVWTDILSIGRTGVISLSGSFTASLSGFGSSVTGTVNYQRCGNSVTLCAPSAITGTSSATGLALSGIPASLRPSSSVLGSITATRDNGSSGRLSSATVASDGTITFELYSSITASPSSTGYTASGSKGLQAGWSLSYLIV
jgi:hypothetical protein